MERFARYAVYAAPEPGPLADFAAAWLGWDPVRGIAPEPPAIENLPRSADELTRAPRKYGFHATLKPPFALAQDSDAAALQADLAALAARLPPVRLDGLALTRIGGFLALTPEGDTSALADLAAETVRALDRHRAPPGAAELARRRAAGLSNRQEALLTAWGYPYVMDEFRFHFTLTGRLNRDEAAAVSAALAPRILPLVPRPFRISELCLFGEDLDGRFHLLHRYDLTG